MPIEPISLELLRAQRDMLRQRATPEMMAARYVDLELPLQLARFAEVRIINEGNRQIEALQRKSPPFKLPADITPEDARRMQIEMRSKLFSYFIWHFPAGSGMVQIVQMVDEALSAIETIRSNHQLEEE